MIDQGAFAGGVPLIHRPDLRDGLVRLVDDQQEVLGEVVDQTVRRATGRASVNVHGVVLDAAARADLTHHLDVIGGAHPQPLRLQQLALPLEEVELLRQFLLDPGNGPFHPLGTRDIVRSREDIHLRLLAHDLPRDRMQGIEPLDLVAEELDAQRELLVDRDDLDGVTAHPEGATGEGEVIARVLNGDEAPQQLVAIDNFTHAQGDHPVDILLRGAQPVDAAHRRHHHDIAAGEQAVGRRMPQPLDLVVDRGVLLDVGVRLRDIRLGLVVVVVTDEVFDRVVGQQLAELVGQLRREGLVGRHDQGRSLHRLDEPRRRRRLACPGRPEEHRVGHACRDPLGQLGDGIGLVAAGLEVGDHLERGQSALQVGRGTHGHETTSRH